MTTTNQLPFLPTELINLIIYKHGGLTTPTAMLMKGYTFNNKYGDDGDGLYIKNTQGGKITIPNTPYNIPFSLKIY